MRIMTANIWGDYFNNPVSVREDQIYSVFKKYDADIIGLQEITSGWYKSHLFEKLHDEYMMIGTELYDNINYVPMVVKKKYKLLAKGYEYLDYIPDESRDILSDESKAITWAVLKDEEKNCKFAVCNTHFWWKKGSQHDEIRIENAQQLADILKHLHNKYSCPVFAFGDMNTVLSSGVFEVYKKNNIKHLHDLAKVKSEVSSHHGNPVLGDDGKYHGSKTSRDKNYSIDHMVVLGDGIDVLEYKIVEDQDALDATDHSPVFVDIEF